MLILPPKKENGSCVHYDAVVVSRELDCINPRIRKDINRSLLA